MNALADLLRPYNRSELARQLGHSTPKRVASWAQDRFSPEVAELPKLAEILRVDLADLTRIVAEDTKRRSAASDSVRPGAVA